MSIKPDSSPVSHHNITLPSPGPGTQRKLSVHTYGDSQANPKFYIQTALHADEIPGMVMLHHLRKLLDFAASEGRITGQIVLVPVANPIGMSQRIQGNLSGRLDLDNGKNYNRCYPDLFPGVSRRIKGHITTDAEKNVHIIRQAISDEIEILPDLTEGDAYRKVLLSLCSDSDYCIDVHCDNEAILYLYTTGSHPQQEKELSATMRCQLHLVDSTTSQCFDGSVSLLWLRLKEEYAEYPIPPSCFGSTLELRGQRDVSDAFGSGDADNFYQFLVSQGAIKDVHRPVPESLCEPTPLEAQIYLKSPHTGIVLYHRECGDQVKKGDVVAEILDPLKSPAEARTEIVSSIDGIIMSRSDQRLLGPGQNIMAVVGKEIIEERVGTHLLSD
jgi:predicted deacylase